MTRKEKQIQQIVLDVLQQRAVDSEDIDKLLRVLELQRRLRDTEVTDGD